MILYIGLIFVFSIVIFFYFLPNHKFYSRPHYLLLLGFSICIVAATFNDLAALIIGKYPVLSKQHNVAVLQQVSSLSLAALGGGIISSAFMIRVQLAHTNRKYILREQLDFLKRNNEDLKKELEQAKIASNKELMSYFVGERVSNKREVRKINKELEMLDKL
ncbi:hypothetical protein [Thalassotalea piscium]|uniref:Uncharacterized protein n=1 Tax=Thalassotalea piscium TaxID=1230533 RepID=A0A7X0NIK9_9GAMM|nr:hypothetical protein [Thalassotalea piscium]MBB6544114.1 hypothetical protein [Thalassotalea piscium]